MGYRARCLILAAHGSMATYDANQPLFDLAERISRHDHFDVVTPAFLNGNPEMTNVLESLSSKHDIHDGDVVIVPMMTSEGYYLKKLPEKFAANENSGNFDLMMTQVVGVHSSIPHRVKIRIDFLVNRFSVEPEDATIVIVGHGTRRNLESCLSTLALTDELEESFTGSGLNFESAFLDQDPSVEAIASSITTRLVMIIPFLISRGPHVTADVPEAFGLPAQPNIHFPFVIVKDRRTYLYDHPLSMYPRIDELCVQLALEQLTSPTPLELPTNSNTDTNGGLTL